MDLTAVMGFTGDIDCGGETDFFFSFFVVCVRAGGSGGLSGPGVDVFVYRSRTCKSRNVF